MSLILGIIIGILLTIISIISGMFVSRTGKIQQIFKDIMQENGEIIEFNKISDDKFIEDIENEFKEGSYEEKDM